MVNVLRCILLLGVCFSAAQAYDILVLVPFPSPSHWLFIEHIVKALLGRGHYITAITNYRTKTPHSNYSELIIDPPYDVPLNFPIKDVFGMKNGGDLSKLFQFWKSGYVTSKHALENPLVQEFMRDEKLKFDLVISEQHFQESFLMFARKFNCPFITIGSMGFSDYMDRNMGILTPWSFVPHSLLHYTDEMSFFQRCHNVFLSLFDAVFRRLYYLPKQNALAQEHFGHLIKEDLPHVKELEKEVSVVLMNAHRSTQLPRPMMPNQVLIGGAHIKPAKPVPDYMQEFMDRSENGVIYMSLGSYIQSADMPIEKLQTFVEVFRNLKQSVIWKYEGEPLENLPPNVKIGKWLPQNDILAHKNVILFITHGGIFGFQESIHRGVPMLIIPFFADQHRNAFYAQNSGYGMILPFYEISNATLNNRVGEMISNKNYTITAKQFSDRFRFNPIPPMVDAMFWIEYSIINKGANFMKSPGAINMPWYKYIMLDIATFFIFIWVASVVLVMLLIKLILRRVRSRGSKSKFKFI